MLILNLSKNDIFVKKISNELYLFGTSNLVNIKIILIFLVKIVVIYIKLSKI